MINRELFQKIHEIISVHPEQHDQGSWESWCGTTRCVAGWAIHLTTGEPVHAPTCDDFEGAEESPATQRLLRESGWHSIPEAARRLLGLDNTDVAGWLFYEASDEEARAAVKAFAEGRDQDALRALGYDW